MKRSERLRDFLTYVGDAAICDPGRDLREVDIGHHVFRRPPEYDTSQDNIVRVNASDLRRRLEDYFQHEGAEDPVVIELPRGTYRPRFTRREAPPAVEIPVPPPEPPPAVKATVSAWWVGALAFLAGAILMWFLRPVTVHAPPATESGDATVMRFWGPLLQGERRTAIILADSNLSLYQDLTQEALTLDDYLRRDYLTRKVRVPGVGQREMEMLMRRRYTSLADAILVNRLSWVIRPADRPRTSVHFAREYPASELRNSNVIIIGSQRSNPWAEPFERDMDFRMEYDSQAGKVSIRNTHPQPGDTGPYIAAGRGNDAAETYAVVGLLPNSLDGGWALLLSGAGMDGTLAAGEFVTSPRWLTELFKRLDFQTGRVPFFEVVLYTKRLGGATGDVEIKALHVHSRKGG